MSVQALPFVSVQADWDDVVREVASNTIPEGTFWIACYLTGKQSVQGSVIVKRTKENDIQLEGKDGITVTNLNSRTFQVECPELGVKDITVYGPKTDFYPVKGKAVSRYVIYVVFVFF
ncbi:hypothetical protein BD770DRAFT_115490 [Pilaira anomala]|nr:hypothetical protein BD770DRAFT_115490 [Pilaira anomala]